MASKKINSGRVKRWMCWEMNKKLSSLPLNDNTHNAAGWSNKNGCFMHKLASLVISWKIWFKEWKFSFLKSILLAESKRRMNSNWKTSYYIWNINACRTAIVETESVITGTLLIGGLLFYGFFNNDIRKKHGDFEGNWK